MGHRERERVRRAFTVCVLVALSCSEAQQQAPPTGPERIILIVVDTLRRDHVSAYGTAAFTPYLEFLAKRGLVFTDAVASFHWTTMSMAALFTGHTPSLETGVRDRPLVFTGRTWCGLERFRVGDDTCVPQGLTTLAEGLRGAGYWTIGVTSNLLLFRPAGFDQGFDRWEEVGAPHSVWASTPPEDRRRLRELNAGPHVNRRTLEALADRPNDRFFLYVHYMDVHDWWYRERRRSYKYRVTEQDVILAELLQEMRASGLLKDAVIVFTSDHGEALGEKHALPGFRLHRGNPAFEPVLRIPLIVVPAELDGSPLADPKRMLRSQDIGGLIGRLAGLDDSRPQPQELGPDEHLISEANYQIYRKGRWKSIWPRKKDEITLFDLSADPGETEDVAGSNPEVVQAHRDRVLELTSALGTRPRANTALTPDDETRLRALGYIE